MFRSPNETERPDAAKNRRRLKARALSPCKTKNDMRHMHAREASAPVGKRVARIRKRCDHLDGGHVVRPCGGLAHIQVLNDVVGPGINPHLSARAVEAEPLEGLGK